MTVISIHPILTGPAIKTRVTLTVIDDGITSFAWVHRTTQIKTDGVADNTGKPCGEQFTFPTGQARGLSSPRSYAQKCTEQTNNKQFCPYFGAVTHKFGAFCWFFFFAVQNESFHVHKQLPHTVNI